MPLLLECGEHEEVPFVSAVELDVGSMGRSTTCCRYIVESGALRKVQVVAAVVSDMGTSNKYDLLLLGCFEDALAKSALPTLSSSSSSSRSSGRSGSIRSSSSSSNNLFPLI